MTRTNGNGSRPETPSARLDTFSSRTQAWDEIPGFAAEVERLGLAQRCGVSVERRRLPGQLPSGRARYTFDIVLSRYDGKRPAREASMIRSASADPFRT
jgi:hypothetical protein